MSIPLSQHLLSVLKRRPRIGHP